MSDRILASQLPPASAILSFLFLPNHLIYAFTFYRISNFPPSFFSIPFPFFLVPCVPWSVCYWSTSYPHPLDFLSVYFLLTLTSNELLPLDHNISTSLLVPRKNRVPGWGKVASPPCAVNASTRPCNFNPFPLPACRLSLANSTLFTPDIDQVSYVYFSVAVYNLPAQGFAHPVIFRSFDTAVFHLNGFTIAAPRHEYCLYRVSWANVCVAVDRIRRSLRPTSPIPHVSWWMSATVLTKPSQKVCISLTNATLTRNDNLPFIPTAYYGMIYWPSCSCDFPSYYETYASTRFGYWANTFPSECMWVVEPFCRIPFASGSNSECGIIVILKL